jgi:hypothetical protein
MIGSDFLEHSLWCQTAACSRDFPNRLYFYLRSNSKNTQLFSYFKGISEHGRNYKESSSHASFNFEILPAVMSDLEESGASTAVSCVSFFGSDGKNCRGT